MSSHIFESNIFGVFYGHHFYMARYLGASTNLLLSQICGIGFLESEYFEYLLFRRLDPDHVEVEYPGLSCLSIIM